jgi:hypothetical protein
VSYFNSEEKMPFFKRKRPDIVAWVEPKKAQLPSQFVVGWDDGVIYLYDRDFTYDPKEDFTKSKIQTSSNNGNKSNFVYKSEVVMKMQNLVEDFDFQMKYKNISVNERDS